MKVVVGLGDIRSSILAAMGMLALGCGPAITLEDDGDADGDGDDGPTSAADGTDADDDDDATSGDDDDDDDDDDAEDGSSDGPMPQLCTDPEEILQSGVDGTVPTGFVRCAEGFTLRAEAVTCEQPEPVGDACTLEGQSCVTDADCTDGAFGRCVQGIDPFLGEEYCGCRYGCATDDDCGEGSVCACGGDGADYPSVSRCIAATCDGPDACETEACAVGTADDGCGISYRMSCLSNEDTCQSDDDCGGGLQDCWPDTQTGVWGCEDFCCCGRPLLVDGAARVASLVPRSDWCEAHGASTSDLDPDQRRQLARHWGEAAQLEHASVASFARFALELMSIGAPPDLLESTQQAMADEIDHARRCFALASSYSAESVGPAPLDVSEVRPATQMDAIARAVIDEACIGETLAAVEAHAALSRATDPAVRETLATIAADELRHAELGWRTLQWALQGCTATTRARLRAYLTKAILDRRRELVVSDEVGDPRLAQHGKLSPSDRARVLRNALDTVVEPCARALMSQLPRVA